MTNAREGALVGTESQVFHGTAAAPILPIEQAQHKRLLWLKIVRTFRSGRDQHLLELHHQRLAALSSRGSANLSRAVS